MQAPQRHLGAEIKPTDLHPRALASIIAAIRSFPPYQGSWNSIAPASIVPTTRG